MATISADRPQARPMAGGRRRVAAIGASALLAAALLGWWLLASRHDARADYLTQPVTRGAVTASVSANGTLNPVTLVNVGTQVSGTVKALHADFNDHVAAGQVLVELDPALLRAQLAQSEAALASSRAALALATANERRARPMRDEGFLTPGQYDQTFEALGLARAQLALASAQVAHDRINLGNTVIRSPVAGVVVNRAIDLGQTVAASFQTPTLFQIAQDLKQMQIDSSFAEADIGSIREGQAVRFTVDAFPERTFSANVRQVRLNPTTVQNVVTYDVVVAVDNPEQILMPGMTAYVSVVLAERADALLIPNAALRYSPEAAAATAIASSGEAKVYVPGKDGPRTVAVRLGITDGHNTEMLSGPLKFGDALITGGAQDAAKASAGAASPLRLRGF